MVVVGLGPADTLQTLRAFAVLRGAGQSLTLRRCSGFVTIGMRASHASRSRAQCENRNRR